MTNSADITLHVAFSSGNAPPPVTKDETDDFWDISDGALVMATGIARSALGCSEGYNPVGALVWKFEPHRGIASHMPRQYRVLFLQELASLAHRERHAQRGDWN